MKLSITLMISFFIVSLVGSAVLIGYSSYTYDKILTGSVHKHLEDIVKIRASHITTFLEGEKNRVIDFSSDGFIKNSLMELNDNPSEEIMGKLTEHLINNKIVVDESIYEVFVLNNEGKVMGTTNPEEEFLTDFSKDSIFLEGKETIYVREYFYDEEFKRDGITLSAPVLNEGEFLGVISIRMTLDELGEIVVSAGKFSQYEELYVVDKNFFMITPSRFLGGENKGILTQKVDTKNSNDCFNHLAQGIDTHPIFVDYLDYRGEKVIGTHDTLPDADWCLLIEVDKNEVLDKPLKKFIKSQIIISIFVITLLTLIGFFAGRYLDKKYTLNKKRRKKWH